MKSTINNIKESISLLGVALDNLKDQKETAFLHYSPNHFYSIVMELYKEIKEAILEQAEDEIESFDFKEFVELNLTGDNKIEIEVDDENIKRTLKRTIKEAFVKEEDILHQLKERIGKLILTPQDESLMKTIRDPNFTQLCVWPGTIVVRQSKDNDIEGFQRFMKNEFNGVRILYSEEVKTLPDMENGNPVAGTGGRNDLFFYVHSEDCGKFAISRLAYGIRWWEDVVSNNSHLIYPTDIRAKYSKTW